MKKNTAYTIGSLVILLICAFCFVILPAFTGGADAHQEKIPAFGKYNGKEIVYEQGSDFYDFVSQYGQMFQNYGQQIDSSTYYYIFNYAFNSTVTKYAYEDAVKASGYTVPKSAVTRQLIPYFSDENGKYSSKLYRQAPASEVAKLRDSVEASLISSRYYDDNFGSNTEIVGSEALYGIKVSDAELDFLTAYDSKKRGFNMAVFAMKDYPTEEITKYGKDNAAKFNKYDMTVVTVADKATAATVAKRVNNVEITIEDAVPEYSTKTYSNAEGKLTNSYQYQIENILTNKEDLATLVDLNVGVVSPVIETNGSYSVFFKHSATVAPDFEDESTVNVVSTYLKNYESTCIEDYFTAKATDFTNEALKSDFASACAKLNIENVEVNPFPLNYGSVSIATSVDTSTTGLSNADTNENFLKTAFSLKMNEISAPIVMNDNVVVLQFTEEATPDEEFVTPTTASDIDSFDENAANNAILSSDKLENNFMSTYFNYMMRS